MTKRDDPRATDLEREIPDAFRPGADPDEWIEQLASPYRERPWAVIRELFQNASDTVLEAERDSARFVELALLSKDTKPAPGTHHLVVRDSGAGMDDATFCKRVGILGLSSKKADRGSIGQFGVGFYSTHAICTEVTVVTKTHEMDQFTVWKYVPQRKSFFRVQDHEIKALLATDFADHPLESRRRQTGTSVFISIDIEHFPQCEDWLTPENLVRDVQRDFFILPVPVFVADYSDGSRAKAVLNMHGVDVSGQQLNVCPAPWEIATEQNRPSALAVLQSQLPYTKPEDLPKEWALFHRPLGRGSVSGIFYLVEGGSDGYTSLCMKRMWVETAKDLKPLACEPVYSLVDFEPDDSAFDIRITAHRDHIVRDGEFAKGRQIIEDEALLFLKQCGTKLVEAIAQETQGAQDPEEKIASCRAVVDSSQFFSSLHAGEFPFIALLNDIPDTLREALKRDDCVPTLREVVKRYVERKVQGHTLDSDDLPHALDAMHEVAERNSAREMASTDRTQITWNPRVSRAFLKQIGPFLPVTIAMRRRRRDGTFDICSTALPLAAIPILDPSSVKGIDVLMKGGAEEYLAKNRERSSVIIPSTFGASIELDESRVLFLGAFAAVNETFQPKLTFVELRRDLFQEISTADAWEPLVACFDAIVNGHDGGHTGGGTMTKLRVCAMGYQGDTNNLIPLLSTQSDDEALLVLNAYNPLMKDLLSAYTNAASRNDPETTGLLSEICHELYHHTLAAEASSRDVDRHSLETRTLVFTRVLNVLQRYLDMKE